MSRIAFDQEKRPFPHNTHDADGASVILGTRLSKVHTSPLKEPKNKTAHSK